MRTLMPSYIRFATTNKRSFIADTLTIERRTLHRHTERQLLWPSCALPVYSSYKSLHVCLSLHTSRHTRHILSGSAHFVYLFSFLVSFCSFIFIIIGSSTMRGSWFLLTACCLLIVLELLPATHAGPYLDDGKLYLCTSFYVTSLYGFFKEILYFYISGQNHTVYCTSNLFSVVT